jgi:hypothetical protein
VSVDTNTKHKNLAPYQRVRHPEFTILISPVLSGMASRMVVDTKGTFVKNLVVRLSDDDYQPLYATEPDC